MKNHLLTNLTAFFCWFVFLYLPTLSIGQDYTKEDIQNLLKNISDDSVKADLLLQFAWEISSQEREKSIDYYVESLRFQKNKLRQAQILDTVGLFHWQAGNFREAILYLSDALDLFIELNDSTWLGKVNNNIAVVNWGIGNTNEALKYYQEALSIRRILGDKIGVSKILNNIGLIYQDWGLYEEAFTWHNNALSIARELNDGNALAYSYSNIGNCYENLNDNKTALKYYLLGYNTLLEMDENNRSNSFFSANIGGIFFKLNKLDSALYHYRKSLGYAVRIQNKSRIAIADYNLGRTYIALNHIDSASFYINRSYKSSLEKEYGTTLRNTILALSIIEEKKGNLKKAFDYYKKSTVLKDSIFNKEKMAKFNDLQIQYSLLQQTRENELLKKNNELQEVTIRNQKELGAIIILGGILILIILFFIAKSRISFKRLNKKLEKSEQGLLKANADKDKFFAIIAHDLKSPFNAILGYTEILKSQYENLGNDEKVQIIDSIAQSANISYKLLENLLIWARTETGKMPFNPNETDISELVKDTISINQLIAVSKNIELINNVNQKQLVYADDDMVNTILRNLISNAIKFTESGGKVTLSTRIEKTKPDYLEIAVNDTGVGINNKDIENMFELSGSTARGTNNEKGTGLGLILCVEFIKKNKGEIWVESELGKGSTFYFTLPIKLK